MQPPLNIEQRYTYADYCTWGEDVHCELIDGVVYDMSPAPGSVHQDLSRSLLLQIGNFLEEKPCTVYHAPYDVRLNADTGDDTVVQPDLVVICDSTKIHNFGCAGAPDMVIEILSPSTASKDMILKYNKYMEAGVREYWIVDPSTRSVRVCLLNDGKYDSVDYLDARAIPVHVLDGCVIDLKKVFKD